MGDGSLRLCCDRRRRGDLGLQVGQQRLERRCILCPVVSFDALAQRLVLSHLDIGLRKHFTHADDSRQPIMPKVQCRHDAVNAIPNCDTIALAISKRHHNGPGKVRFRGVQGDVARMLGEVIEKAGIQEVLPREPLVGPVVLVSRHRILRRRVDELGS